MRQLKISKSITNRSSEALDKYLVEIGREPMVSIDEEIELAQKIRKGGREGERAKEKLVKANLRFVVSVAKQYQHQGLGLTDLIDEGNIGLVKAAEKFDETRGFKFISYAVWWIRQSILQAIAEQSRIVRLPLNQVGALSKISAEISKFEQENQRKPSVAELAQITKMEESKIDQTIKADNHHMSIDAPFGSDDDDNAMVDVMASGDDSRTDKGEDDKTPVKETNELSKAETKERIICLCLVFAVVIFFWMAFHQNGNTLTLFARDYTQKTSEGLQSMAFDVTNLVACIFVVYGCFGLAQSKTGKGKGISLGVIVAAIAFLFYKYSNLEGAVDVEAPIFQQFNPCYVVALTPVSVALFSWLHKIGKEPTSPEKIGLGMLVAALGFVWMAVGSMGLELPLAQGNPATEGTRVSANLLISTYLILTFAELLLSPIGISFVSKVAPPKYAGLMMGLWFGATAIGNQLVMIPGIMWGQNFNLIAIWGVLAGICLVSALFIFSIIKKLNRVS